MKFIKAEKLKTGMRLARPIYSKKGVLLFERNSKLTLQAIESVHNFGLLGVYILEPAEPVPPMTQEDLEFERFQTMAIFSIREELEHILSTGRQKRIHTTANMIIRKYGHLEEKINFCQSLRSREDYVFKHSLNVAILCAMMTHMMNVRLEEQLHTVLAAIVHDIGKVGLAKTVIDSDELTEETREQLFHAQAESMGLIENIFTDGVSIRRICVQAMKAQAEMENGMDANGKMVTGAKILLVANRYDEMTVMKLGGSTDSEVKAIQEFREHPKVYDPAVVEALTASVNILFPGVSVELNSGEKALVLAEGSKDVLRPVVLKFQDNSVIDLSSHGNEDIEVVDIMKTLDNRYIMDTETLIRAGYQVKEQETETVSVNSTEKRETDAHD